MLRLGQMKISTPNAVYLLADHLDSVLAAGEDLVRLTYTVPAADREITAEAIAEDIAARGEFASRLRAFELVLIGRIMQARTRAAELKRADARFAMIVSLFESGTLPLVDAVADLGNAEQGEFDCCGDPLAFLRQTGMIAADAPGLSSGVSLQPGEAFKVAGRIELGPLLDLAATFLDTLELHYEVFTAAEPSEEDAPAERPSSLLELLAAMPRPPAS